MAKYNREFLVQYFRDIYALYALRRRIKTEIRETDELIRDINRGVVYNPKPAPPKRYEREVGIIAWVFVVLGGLLLILSCAVLSEVEEDGRSLFIFLIVLSLIVIIGCIWFICSDINETKRLNELSQSAYEAEMDLYYHNAKENDKHRESIPLLQNLIVNYENEICKVDKLINKLYSVNIVPSRYRDFYAIVYLYDYFEGSRETDLGMALNTYVLEQIKDRLDMLISQMSKVILNQYTMIATQQAAMEQAKQQHNELRRLLNRIAVSDEEQNIYLEMIQANTATIKYFTAAEYLKEW